MVEHRRHHAARSARRGRHHGAARSVLFGGRQRIGVDFGAGVQRIGVAFRLDPIGRGFAGDFQAAGQYAVVVQSPLDGFAHHGPYPIEVVPDFGTFAVVHILPVGLAFAGAPLLDLRNGGHRVDACGHLQPRGLVGERTAADAVYRPRIGDPALFEPLEQHAVGVEGEYDFGFPDDFGRGDGFEHREDRYVRKVAFARGRQRSVERHAVGIDIAAPFREAFRSPFGSHRVAARRAVADLIEFFERFHNRDFTGAKIGKIPQEKEE